MIATNILRRTLNLVFPSLLVSLVRVPVLGAEFNAHPTPQSVETVNVVQTSSFPRAITNVIEVWVPTNVFVNVYHTNQFAAQRTNVFDVYRTNWVSRTLTNTIAVELRQTNLVTRYQTNVVTAYQTNLNVVTLTNLVTRHRTNVNTLSLTNWQTVLMFKTNWITQPVTNLVQLEVPADQAASAPAAGDVESKGDIAAAPPIGGPILEARRTAKPSVNGQAEISLKLKSAGNEAPTFLSQEWQVERSDRSVLLFGRGPEFRREVPLGTYKVEVKTRSTEDSPVVRVRGNFEVLRDEVILSRPAGLVNVR
jgi:hypothetical protein